MFSRRRLHTQRITLWLAIFAMALHALLPGLAQAHAASGSQTVELCTVFGIKKVAVSADEAPTSPTQDTHKNLCPLCALAGAAVLPSTTDQLFFSALQAAAPPAPLESHHTSGTLLLPASRGPPLVS